jgi:hypothetical protein
MKSAARRILGPIARPILWRIRRFTHVRREVDTLAAAWHQHLPAMVNATISVAAIGRDHARMKREYDTAIGELRAEIAKLRGAGTGAQGVRLQLGRGNASPEGYVVVDTQQAPGVDVVSPFGALPFAPAQVAEIRVALDRFQNDELRQLLPYWTGLLKPGGILRVGE